MWEITEVNWDERRRVFELRVSSCSRPPQVLSLCYPYGEVTPAPAKDNPVVRCRIFMDACSFWFVLRSEAWGRVSLDDVFAYEENRDFLRLSLLEKLTDEASHRLATSGRTKVEVIRRLGTSRAQLSRLLARDQSQKTLDGLVKLIHALDGVVEFTVRDWTPFEPD